MFLGRRMHTLRSMLWLMAPVLPGSRTDVVRRDARAIVARKAGGPVRFALSWFTDRDRFRALYSQVFKHMTTFFRDVDVFTAIEEKVLPRIARRIPHGGSLRIWVPGCSSGEEAYSLAIAVAEVLANRADELQVRVFGSDRTVAVVEQARTGVYPESSLGNVSPDRRRYFTAVEGGYQASESIRKMCSFARHDLVTDPSLGDLDLICCRNVLGFFVRPADQARILRLFHQSLRPGGYLVLGKREPIAPPPELFAPVDRRKRIFRRNADEPR